MYTAIESTCARGEGNKKYPTAARPHYSQQKKIREVTRADKFKLKLYCYEERQVSTDLLNHVALTLGKNPKNGLMLDDFSYFSPETDLKQIQK
jgi:hypothetical protein